MNLFKKLSIGVSTAALVLACATPVFGKAETSNTGIDDHSYVNTVADDLDTMTAAGSSQNTALANLDIALANSGLNFQVDDEDGNTMESMSAGSLWETENFVNVSETEFTEGSGAKATNSNISDHSGDPCGQTCSCCPGCDGCGTGCGSCPTPTPCQGCPDCPPAAACPQAGPVTAIANDSDNFSVSNSNVNTALLNLTASIANSGLNFQIGNEDGNSQKTGETLSGAYASNVVNNNKTAIGSTTGGAEAGNTAISDHSYATSEAYDNDRVAVSNGNSGTALANVTASLANSGLNFQVCNEDGNSIETGESGSVTKTENFVNVSETSVAVGGGAKATNGTVSDHSFASSVATDNDTVTVANSNTGTNVLSVSASIANSGGNGQIKNEDTNSIKTGAVTALGSTSNVVNGNQVTVK